MPSLLAAQISRKRFLTSPKYILSPNSGSPPLLSLARLCSSSLSGLRHQRLAGYLFLTLSNKRSSSHVSKPVVRSLGTQSGVVELERWGVGGWLEEDWTEEDGSLIESTEAQAVARFRNVVTSPNVSYAAAHSAWKLFKRIGSSLSLGYKDVERYAALLCAVYDQIGGSRGSKMEVEWVVNCFEEVTRVAAKRGWEPRLSTLLRNVRYREQIGETDSETGRGIMEKMQLEGFEAEPESIRSLLGRTTEGNDTDGQTILNWIRATNIAPAGWALGWLIHAYVARDMLEEGLKQLHQLKEAGWPTDASVYNDLMAGYVRRRNLEMGKKLFAEMCEAGLQPTEYTYAILLHLYLLEESMPLVEDLLSMLNENNVKLDVVMYNTMIHRLSGMGRFDDAMKMVEQLMRSEVAINDITYNTVMLACARHQRPVQGSRFHHLLLQKGLNLNRTNYEFLTYYFIRVGEITSARECLKDMSTAGFAPTIFNYNVLIRGAASAKNLDGALDLLADLKQTGLKPNENTYAWLLVAASAVNNLQLCIDLFAELETITEHPHAIAYKSMIWVLSENDLLEDAARYLQAGRERGREGLKGAAWGYLAQGYARRGEFSNAIMWLERHRHEGALTPPPYSCYDSVLFACSRARPVNREQVLQIVRLIEEHGHRIGTNTMDHVLISVLDSSEDFQVILKDMSERKLEWSDRTVLSIVAWGCRDGIWELCWEAWKFHERKARAEAVGHRVSISPLIAAVTLQMCRKHRKLVCERIVRDVIAEAGIRNSVKEMRESGDFKRLAGVVGRGFGREVLEELEKVSARDGEPREEVASVEAGGRS